MAAIESGERAFSRALERVVEELGRISSKLDRIIEMDERILERSTETRRAYVEEGVPELPLDVMTLLSLPDHLRKSAMVVCRKNEGATATEVAGETSRARAVESSYLNQLVTLGHLKKRRKGRKVYFYIAK